MDTNFLLMLLSECFVALILLHEVVGFGCLKGTQPANVFKAQALQWANDKQSANKSLGKVIVSEAI